VSNFGDKVCLLTDVAFRYVACKEHRNICCEHTPYSSQTTDCTHTFGVHEYKHFTISFHCSLHWDLRSNSC